MAEIKTEKNAFESLIKIKRWVFDALLIMRVTWRNLSGPSEIQGVSDSHSCILLKPLIED